MTNKPFLTRKDLAQLTGFSARFFERNEKVNPKLLHAKRVFNSRVIAYKTDEAMEAIGLSNTEQDNTT